MTSIEVGHGAGALAVWGEQRGHRFCFVLTPDEAGALAARLVQQARHARDHAATAEPEPSR